MLEESRGLWLLLLLLLLGAVPGGLTQSASSGGFVYVGCSTLRYASGSSYESNVNSILSSLVNSAAVSTYNTFNVSEPTLYGLFQCRGDISGSACMSCVSAATSRLGSTCGDASGGAVQLEGCFVRYDNVSFVGLEDKTVVVERCGASSGNGMREQDDLLSSLMGGDGGTSYFRTAESGRVRGVAQCIQDLSVGECQDCLSEAMQRLGSLCSSSAWGDMFLGKCYARYSSRGYTPSPHPGNTDQEEVQRDLAILIGLIAGVTLLVVFVSFFSRLADRSDRNRDGK